MFKLINMNKQVLKQYIFLCYLIYLKYNSYVYIMMKIVRLYVFIPLVGLLQFSILPFCNLIPLSPCSYPIPSLPLIRFACSIFGLFLSIRPSASHSLTIFVKQLVYWNIVSILYNWTLWKYIFQQHHFLFHLKCILYYFTMIIFFFFNLIWLFLNECQQWKIDVLKTDFEF